MANLVVAACGRVFDLDALINGETAPCGTTDINSGHTTVYWPGEGQFSWDNPGQTSAHWSDHTPEGKVAGQKPAGATFRGE